MKKEEGAASIIVTMENGKLKVIHESTWDVLHERDADAGIWDAIWDVIKNYQTDEPIKVWTYFLGDKNEMWNFVTEWSGILEREVTYDLTINSNGETSWYCETMATKKQIFDYDMDSDWIVER